MKSRLRNYRTHVLLNYTSLSTLFIMPSTSAEQQQTLAAILKFQDEHGWKPRQHAMDISKSLRPESQAMLVSMSMSTRRVSPDELDHFKSYILKNGATEEAIKDLGFAEKAELYSKGKLPIFTQ